MAKTKEITLPSSLNSLVPVGKRFGKDVYADNPFLEIFTIETRERKVTAAAGITGYRDSVDNEVSAAAISVFQTVDQAQFLKIFVENAAPILDLGAAAKRLFQPLMLEIQRNAKDVAHVYFTLVQATANCKTLGLQPPSQATFSRGMSEMVDKGLVAVNANGPGWWWINPNILFNGDRVAFVKAYQIKRKTEKALENQQFRLL